MLYTLPQGFSIQTGYDAITVALLGSNQPWGILLASLFLGGLNNGSTLMEALVGFRDRSCRSWRPSSSWPWSGRR